MRAFHERYDLLVTPTLAVPAVGAEEREAERSALSPASRTLRRSSAAFNLTKQPAASVPVGHDRRRHCRSACRSSAPLYADAPVLRACHAIEMARPFARPICRAARRAGPAPVPRGIASMAKRKPRSPSHDARSSRIQGACNMHAEFDHRTCTPSATIPAAGGIPKAWTDTVHEFRADIETAKTAERGKFDMLFISRRQRRQDGHARAVRGQLPDRPSRRVFEPVTLLSALAMHT